MRLARGIFITFEGLDGTGKSTQLERLAATLSARGFQVLATREPGGSAIGERIRTILLDARTAGLSPFAELALMFADRAQHVDEVIAPALRARKIVLCDRYTDSTEAYQGGGRELGSEIVLDMHRELCHDLWPDLTLLLDSDLDASVARARNRNQTAASSEVRFDNESAAFFRRVQRGFEEIALRDTHRVKRISAGTIQSVEAEILKLVDAAFPELGKIAFIPSAARNRS
jgi:dTMP kinase